MVGRTTPCSAATRAGRLRKAKQFHEAAHVVEELADEARDVADTAVTLLVHAGIAAADVLCCASLGSHAQGENHHEAVALLATFNRERSSDLRTLLQLKTKAGYSSQPISEDERKRARRACDRLVEAAEELPT